MGLCDEVISQLDLNDLAVQNFRDYLRIPSVHPDIDYTTCIDFLKRQAESMDLKFKIYTYHTGKPIVIITVPGKDSILPSILLNSHMDVVPVFEDLWTYKPFDAHMDEKGNIYGRGTQDMKSVGIQYLEAVRRLKKNGILLRRTLHLCFVPDEEIGGESGMKMFANSKDFAELNVGFALDEGVASPTDTFYMFYGERTHWHMAIHCTGQPGHGSLLFDSTAGEKASCILKKFYEFRSEEVEKLKNNIDLTIGDVISINLTQVQGGLQANVIPAEIILIIDCRIPVTIDLVKWEATLNQWCIEAGEGIWVEFLEKNRHSPTTTRNDSNPYWVALKTATDNMKLDIKEEMLTGTTDTRFIRELGVEVVGFSPMNNTPVLMHDNDEYLNSKVFLRGIEIYYEILQSIGNC